MAQKFDPILGQLRKDDTNGVSLIKTGDGTKVLHDDGAYNAVADIDLSNLTSEAPANLNAAGARTVVETYQNGTEWYRIWSDDWIEQGGFKVNNLGTAGTLTLTLLVEYSDTNYYFNRSPHWIITTIGPTSSLHTVGYNTKTTSTVFFYTHYNVYTDGYDWYACGY